MSFGRAALTRGRRPRGDAACPCGSGAVFAGCCGPVLAGDAARTAAQLMRSRFTAFALGDAAHLMASWHPATRPESLELDDDRDWERLDIDPDPDAGADAADAARATVAFRAYWREKASGRRGVLRETSRFRHVEGRWLYLDGAVDRGSAS